MFFDFSMADAQMDPNDNKSSFFAKEEEPVTAIYLFFWKWEDQRLDYTLGTKLAQSPTKNRVSIA